MTEVRFNPYHIRRYGLSSTQEAKVLLYLERRGGQACRRDVSRVFDLRLVERLALLGLVVRQGEQVRLTESGREVLQGCLREEAHGRRGA